MVAECRDFMMERYSVVSSMVCAGTGRTCTGMAVGPPAFTLAGPLPPQPAASTPVSASQIPNIARPVRVLLGLSKPCVGKPIDDSCAIPQALYDTTSRHTLAAQRDLVS